MGRHSTINLMWVDALISARHTGALVDSRNGPSYEIIGWSGTLTDVRHNFLTHQARRLSARYAVAELAWYLAGSDLIEQIAHWAPSYKQYSDDGVRAYGAYGPRLMLHWEETVALIKRAAHNRRIVIPIFKPDDLGAETKDLPCTCSLQFIPRQGTLHMVVFMRSNDLWKGFPYDVFCFSTLLKIMAHLCNLNVGTYTHHIGSCHLYSTNMHEIDRSPSMMWPGSQIIIKDFIDLLVINERRARNGEPVHLPVGNTLIHDLVACLYGEEPSCQQLAEGVRNDHRRGK